MLQEAAQVPHYLNQMLFLERCLKCVDSGVVEVGNVGLNSLRLRDFWDDDHHCDGVGSWDDERGDERDDCRGQQSEENGSPFLGTRLSPCYVLGGALRATLFVADKRKQKVGDRR